MSIHFLLSAQARTLSLAQVMRLTDDEAFKLFCGLRWADNGGEPVCPKCGCVTVYTYASRRIFKCKGCNAQFSATLWGFTYKTCGFSWMKADQYKLFALEEDVYMGLGYWTRANSEICLLATRGKPERLDAGVRQGIIEPKRYHSRKPDCVYGRIERLVEGPYLELFARTQRPGWTAWGNEINKFRAVG